MRYNGKIGNMVKPVGAQTNGKNVKPGGHGAYTVSKMIIPLMALKW